MRDNRLVPNFEEFAGNPDFVLSLARGLIVIEAFQDRLDGVTIGDVATRTQLSRAAVRRALITLELLGYASHTGPVYRLTSRVLKVGFSFLSSQTLPSLAVPMLDEISATLQESSSLSVLEGDEILYLARSATKRVMAVGLVVGSRLPAYCTSMGRVLLAALDQRDLSLYLNRVNMVKHTSRTIASRAALESELDRVRDQGYAIVNEELELGLRSIAVPVATRSGRVVAAMNTGVQASRVSARQMVDRFLPVLKQGATALGQSLA